MISKNRLYGNIISLFTIKGLEYILALIMLPYLVRVLEPEKFGVIAFAQSFAQYFVLFTDYGFNLSAPRALAVAASARERKQIFSEVFAAKCLLGLIAAMFYGVGIAVFAEDQLLFGATFLLVLGNVVFPVWFFQGIQEMKYITYANVGARLISAGFIFAFVNAPDDCVLAAFLQSITSLLAGIFAFLILLRKYRYIFGFPQWICVKKILRRDWELFLSTAAINSYAASNTFFLGLFVSPYAVGYYAAAEKIIKTVTRIMEPVSQAIYPHISALAAKSPQDAILFLHRCMKYFGGGMLAVSIGIFFFADFVVRLVLGEAFIGSVSLLRLLAFLPVVIALSNVFGILTMLPFGMKHLFSKVVFLSAGFNLCILGPLIYVYQAQGACAAMLGTEIFVSAVMGAVLWRRKINVFF